MHNQKASGFKIHVIASNLMCALNELKNKKKCQLHDNCNIVFY